jgi:nickel-dependent lactate racemase
MSHLRLRTGAWHGDRAVDLAFPDDWEVTVFWPRTPKPLSDGDIDGGLEHPTDQAPIRKLCAGSIRPVLVVDDLNRPTPVSVVMPKVLAQFKQAGVPLDKITIVLASGMHDPPRQDAIVKKLGSEAVLSCRVITHDFKHGVTMVGKTRFGTPVWVNTEVAQSDFVLGIGGAYPNHTAGFGGGSKLALGILGCKSIAHLHSHRRTMGWGTSAEGDFRQDLDEIARLLNMRTMITLHVNADREVVHMHSGDHFTYYKEAVAFSRAAYSAPPPEGADVVVSNAYPNDASLTFARMKGMLPLYAWAPPRASRVAMAACTDGMGLHNLFPLAKFPDPAWIRAKAHHASVMSFQDIGKKLARRIMKSARRGTAGGRQRPPVWLYCTDKPIKPLPSSVSDMRMNGCWQSIVEAISREQEQKKRLRVFVYPCAPLQFLA